MVDVAPLAAFVNEREAVRLRKEHLEQVDAVRNGGETYMTDRQSAAWGSWKNRWRLDRLTDDLILRQYRFCNVRREDDRVTRWIAANIREPFAEHPHLWLMLAIARTINWPPTLEELIRSGIDGGWPNYVGGEHSITGWTPARMASILEARKDRGDKVYTGAYMIRAPSSPTEPWFGWSKQRYIAEIVIGMLWENRHDWVWAEPEESPTSEGVWEYLQMFTGWGPFMAYQVVVDLQHTRYLRDAPDVNTWAALGPGSRRGLNRLYGRPVGAPLSQEAGLAEMVEMREALKSHGLAPWVELPCLSDVQNCLCEFDKYERVRLGEGRPRTLYVPGRGY